MKKDRGEHAPVVRTATMVISSSATALAMMFVGFQSCQLRNTITEQTAQTKLSRNAVTAQTWQNLTQPGYAISRVFVDHPNLRPYFYNSKSLDKADPNFDAVMAVAEMFLDFFDSFEDGYVYDLPGMAVGGEFRVLWERYFQDMFTLSPALCACAMERRGWYSEKTISYADSAIRAAHQTSSNEVSEVAARTQAAPQR